MFFLASSYPKAPAPGRVLGVCWERASCRECACSCFLMPRGSCSHKSDTPCWTTCMEDCLYKEDRLWCAKIISTDWRPPHHEKQKVFSPMMKKNNYGRITFFFFSSIQTVQWELKYHHPDIEYKRLKCTRTDERCY